MSKPKAFITGITGQDGSYLAEFLLSKGYRVSGLVRRVAFEGNDQRMVNIESISDKIELFPGAIESYPSLYKAIRKIKPDEIYHLAAQSYVSNTFEDEFSTLNTNINGTHGLLAACCELVSEARLYFAGSSEMFGNASVVPQNEECPFRPRSAYGISKVAGFHLIENYRNKYGLFACSGISYNHESSRRGDEFVTKKISSSVARIKYGLQDRLELGNLGAQRDWGCAREYVEAMWLMLQNETPEDYVIATGFQHSVREFCEIAFEYAGLDYREWVVSNPRFFRNDDTMLLGDASKIKNDLGMGGKKEI